ncbi:hypothetical protein ETAE_3406 [Edwardsiella piscicida]|uniref:Uncharacterized protein n=2 Tax=Edwardsiella TaxID=635 RepID=A0A0H3DXC7_EDWTF|nr:hypothetical protein ETAE_3406 [Edwardsiella tarda EIB202]ADM43190.1 hypothetical protein ETAF_3087 [Edwardsiella tarda FL6-60]
MVGFPDDPALSCMSAVAPQGKHAEHPRNGSSTAPVSQRRR